MTEATLQLKQEKDGWWLYRGETCVSVHGAPTWKSYSAAVTYLEPYGYAVGPDKGGVADVRDVAA